MAEAYRRVRGKKLTKIIAQHADVQAALDDAAVDIALAAEARLAEHRHDGDAYIDVDTGRVDRYVVLNDERGQDAAMTIEKGRKPNDEGRGGMAGLNILAGAAGLPHDSEGARPRGDG